jgi:hypothetical protein
MEKERERGITMYYTSYLKRKKMRTSRTNYQTLLRGDEKREEGLGITIPLFGFYFGEERRAREDLDGYCPQSPFSSIHLNWGGFFEGRE